ncbi:MAG: UPF0182 family protein [Brevinemataceae bacterium]
MKALQKILVISLLVVVFLGLFAVLSADIFLNLFWLKTQNTLYTALKLFTFRRLTIPIFGIIMGAFSLLHIVSASKEERKNGRFLQLKTLSIVIICMVLEFFLQISQYTVFALLGGLTGVQDPLTGMDMSLHLFWLPLIKRSVFFFFCYFSVLFFFRLIYPAEDSSKRVDKICFLNVLGCFIVLIVFLRLDMIVRMSADSYLGYMDIYGKIVPFAASLIFCYIIFVISFMFADWNSKAGFFIILGLSIVLVSANIIWPMYLNFFVYRSNPGMLDEKFAGIHAESTRRAFGVQELIKDRSFVVAESNLIETISNNFWQDSSHFVEAVRYNQEIIPYFSINNAFPILLSNNNDVLNPYFISPREIQNAESELWDAKYFRNIFGYGAVIGSASEFDKEGYPVLVLKDLELNSSFSNLNLVQPEIFFSDSYSNFVFVNTSMPIPDFKYSRKELSVRKFDNVLGIKVNSFIKFLLTLIHRDSRFFLTSYFLPDTALILKRRPSDIVKSILPMFHYDTPKLTYHNQELWWEIDGYYTSQSVIGAASIETPWGNANWIRSPLKAYVSAYSGDVVFEITEPQDPYAKTARRFYPSLFEKRLEFSKEKYLYPKVLFEIQSKILAEYHETDASRFYSGISKREISRKMQTSEEISYIFLNSEKKLAYQHTYTYFGKSIFAARLLGFVDEQGEKVLHLFESPPTDGIAGRFQAESFLNQDPVFSQLSTLWGQVGSKVSLSEMVFYPSKNQGIYLGTVFIQSESASIPLAQRFFVIKGAKIILTASIKDLLTDDLISETDLTEDLFANKEDLRRLLRQLYQYYLDAEKSRINGNTQEYQQNVDKIGRTLSGISL